MYRGSYTVPVHAFKRTQLVKINFGEFLGDIPNTNSMHVIVLGEQVLTNLLCISVYFLICMISFMTYKMHPTPVTGPLVPHEICSNGKVHTMYTCMVETRKTENRFFVKLRFWEYLVTIAVSGRRFPKRRGGGGSKSVSCGGGCESIDLVLGSAP